MIFDVGALFDQFVHARTIRQAQIERDRELNRQYEIYQKETKMTREEAIKKLTELAPSFTTSNNYMCNVLEALGLIKFDAKKDHTAAEVIELFKPVCSGRDVINNLEAAGYRIVKLGKNTNVFFNISNTLAVQCFQGKLSDINQQESGAIKYQEQS